MSGLREDRQLVEEAKQLRAQGSLSPLAIQLLARVDELEERDYADDREWFRRREEEAVRELGRTVLRLEAVEARLAAVLDERDTLRTLARMAKVMAAAPDYDEEAIRYALWAVVDAAISQEGEKA